MYSTTEYLTFYHSNWPQFYIYILGGHLFLAWYQVLLRRGQVGQQLAWKLRHWIPHGQLFSSSPGPSRLKITTKAHTENCVYNFSSENDYMVTVPIQ